MEQESTTLNQTTLGLDQQLSLTASQTASAASPAEPKLPAEIMSMIFQNLGYKDLKNIRLTCRTFRAIVEQPIFDSLLFKRPYQEGAFAKIHAQFDPVRAQIDSWNRNGLRMLGILTLSPDQFPIKVHPALLTSSLGGFASEVLDFPLRLRQNAPYRNEMATQPALQQLWIYDKQKNVVVLLKNEQGITVGAVIKSLLQMNQDESRRSSCHQSERFPLDEAGTRIQWQAQDHTEESIKTKPPILSFRLQAQFLSFPHWRTE